MFDRTIFMPGRTRTEYVTTTEKRAPTDESVRLLREMEAKAREQVDAAVRVDGNGFSALAHLEFDCMSDQNVVRIHFDLNARREVVTVRANRHEDLPAKCRAAVIERLSEVIMAHTFACIDSVRRMR